MEIVSPDDYRTTNGVYQFIPKLEPMVWGRAYLEWVYKCEYATTAWLIVGIPGCGKSTWLAKQGMHGVAFDATSLTIAARRPIIALATAKGCDVRAVYMSTDIATCLERNSKRSPDRRVPDDIVTAMAAKVELPTEREGFFNICERK